MLHFSHTSAEVLIIITVTHLDQACQLTVGMLGIYVQGITFLAVIIGRPVTFISCKIYIIEAGNIGLVNLYLRLTCYTGKGMIGIGIYQRLSADLDYISAAAGISVSIVKVYHVLLFRFHINNLGKLIHQQVTLVTQLVSYTAGVHFYNVYLLVKRRQLFRYGINTVHINLYLLVNIILKLLHISVHIIKICSQISRLAYHLLAVFGVVGVLCQFFQGVGILTEYRGKALYGLVIPVILLYAVHVVFFHFIGAQLGLVLPVFLVIESVPYTLNSKCLHARAHAAIGCESSYGFGSLGGHILAAVALGLHIGDIICRGIKGCISSLQTRICCIKSHKSR